MREVGETANFVWLINRPNFGRLSNRNDARLNVVLVADAVVYGMHGFDGQLPLFGRNRDQLAAGKFLRSAAFVDIDMCALSADHGVVGVGQRLQTETVRSCAVKYEEDLYVVAELPLELPHRGVGVRVVPVSDHMSLVHRGKRFQDLRVYTGIVVAGKTARSLHG